MFRKRIAWGLMTLASLTIVLVVSRYLGQPLASRTNTPNLLDKPPSN